MKLLLATRSRHKDAEIRRILAPVEGLELVSPAEAGLPPIPEEDEVERFDAFEENARAKALHFRERSGIATLADDSGLEVDALAGAPGVRSKRFAPEGATLTGEDRDRANNEHLLASLADVGLARRTARFVCVAALALGPDEVRIFRGEVRGLILTRPRGAGGFGYDPLFYARWSGRGFAELTPEEKNRRSHRGRAFREVLRYLRSREAPGEAFAAKEREEVG